MADAPTGTVTFLFSDLEGSTRLWEQHPAAMRPALARHDAILRAAVDAEGGTTVKTTGDGIHAAFATVDAGVAAAVAAQEALVAEPWGETGPLRVRIGLHTGAADRRGGDYYGPTLNRAARLMAAAHGGQVVCSQASEELVVDSLPPDVELVDLGEHRLQDLARPERVYQVWAPGLPRDFPPLRSVDAYPGNLPVQPTSFVGRDDDLAAVDDLLRGARVVTLVGPGGVGKTRLALQAAARAVPRHRDGAFFVDLAPVGDPALVASTLAAALGLAEPRQGSVVDNFVSWLRARATLLVVDNCEHLLDATAELVDAVVRGGTSTTVLATSREALGILGESTYPVPPLPVPAPDAAAADAAADSPAVALFAERAHAARHAFTLGPDNAAQVVELCRRLDGIPLALELAAARVQVMSPADILERLDERFRILARGRRAGRSRHQTLRAAVDWSYELLTPAEQRVFDRVCVFAGGFRLDAAQAVASGEGVDEVDVADSIDRLAAQSMVVVDDTGGSTRYRLLETLREYGWERLVDAGDVERVRTRHAAYLLGFAEEAAPHFVGRDDVAWSARLDAERENLQAALEWIQDCGDGPALVRLVRALGHHWWHANDWRHSYHWFERAAQHTDGLRDSDRAEFLAQFGHVAMGLSRWDEARAILEESIGVSKRCDEPPEPLALLSLGNANLESNRGEEAVSLGEQARDAAATRREPFWYGYALAALSVFTSTSLGTGAEAPAEEALDVARALQNRWLLGLVHFCAGQVRSLTSPVEALALFDEAIAIGSTVDRFTVAQARFFRGIANQRLHRPGDAARDLSAALALMRELGGDYYTETVLGAIAALVASRDQADDALLILGALEGMRERWGVQGAPADIAMQRRVAERMGRRVDPATVTRLWAEGRELDVDDTVAVASAALAPMLTDPALTAPG